MTIIDSTFLRTGASWSSSELENLTYSFEHNLPLYFGLNPPLNFAHSLYFQLGTSTELSAIENANFIDQQDIIRYLLDSPSLLSSYTDTNTVSTILVNTANPVANYRISFSDVISAGFSEDTSGVGELAILNQNAYSASDAVRADSGIISSRIPRDVWNKLIATGRIQSRPYEGFGGTLNTVEFLLSEHEAIDAFNAGRF